MKRIYQFYLIIRMKRGICRFVYIKNQYLRSYLNKIIGFKEDIITTITTLRNKLTYINYESISMICIFMFCSILYIISKILDDTEQYIDSDSIIEDEDKKDDLSIFEDNKNKSFKLEDNQYNKLNSLNVNQNKSWIRKINFNLIKDSLYNNNLFDLSNKYKTNFDLDIKNNLNEQNILYKISEYEKDKKQVEIDTETVKTYKEYRELQERLDKVSICKNSNEFNKLPYDIKQLAKENIFDEEIYLKDKKNEKLNKLSNLHLEKIDLLIRSKENR